MSHSTRDNLVRAQAHVEQALRLSPSLAVGLGELGRLKVFGGETDAGRALAAEALECSPYDPHTGMWRRTMAIASWMDEDHQSALEQMDFVLESRPGWFMHHWLRAVILSETGRSSETETAAALGAATVGAYTEQALRFAHPFADEAVYLRFRAGLARAGVRFLL